MPPNKESNQNTGSNLVENEQIKDTKDQPKANTEYKLELVWSNIIIHTTLHIGCVYSILFLSWKVQWYSLLFAWALYCSSIIGITAGPHRLWSHKSYSAKLPLRIFLAAISSITCQNSIYIWCRDHRVHHKFTETDGDPHNAKRGFFFSHVGWLLLRKHPEVIEKGAKIDFSDLLDDPVVYYQHKIYYPLILLTSFIMPTLVPHYVWGESLWNAFFVCVVMRLVLTLNMAWCVNSVAHMWGNRPYDESIGAVESIFVSSLGMGEGWHNYHHVFPFDYRAAELPWRLNPTTQFIDFMYFIGQAYGLKYMTKESIRSRAIKHGDGSIYPREGKRK